MDRKIVVILVILIACTSALVMGCTSKSPTSTPPTATAQPTLTTPTSTPLINSVTPVPTATSPGNNVSGIDESLLNISGEQDESLPEDSIATPDAGQ